MPSVVPAVVNPPRPGPVPALDTTRLGYLPAFDGLRAICILSVMAHHSTFFQQIMPTGGLGVDIFFVMTGFLITTLLLKEHARTGGIDFSDFFVRRALRLYPVLLLLIACMWVATLWLEPWFKTDTGLMASVTVFVGLHLSNWALAFDHPWPGPLDPLWSLALSEQFYLVWPPVLWWLLRRQCRRWLVVGALAAGVLLVVGWRFYLWRATHSYSRCYFATDTRADGVLVGCIFALCYSFGWMKRFSLAAPVAAGALALLAAGILRTSENAMFSGGFTLVALTTGVLLVELAANPWRVLTVAWLRWLGRLSYSVYLWHGPVFYLVQKSPLQHRIGLALPLEFALAFLCAAGSFYLVERPFLRWKRRRFPSPGERPSRDLALSA